MNRKTFYKNLLKKYHLRPSKRLGQNFLIDETVLQKIIQTADLSKKDIVLEIGSGLGILTQELAKRAKKVIAVEKDKNMVKILKEILKDYQNVEIIEGDILHQTFQGQPLFKIIANLPYYITSPVIRMFLELKNPPQEMVLLVQKEVAQRICAQPPKMSLLTVAVQFYSQPKIISYVSKKSFWPQPKVEAAILKISQIKKPQNIDIQQFFRIVKAGFSAPRKQLINNLSKGLKSEREKIKKALLDCGLNPKIRAESLSAGDWIKLSEKLD
jgi:16S rRNA (adenine1518-N6/adenine1519-N6)-dimethyltransferase